MLSIKNDITKNKVLANMGFLLPSITADSSYKNNLLRSEENLMRKS